MKICDWNSRVTSDVTILLALCPKMKSVGGYIWRERCDSKVASSRILIWQDSRYYFPWSSSKSSSESSVSFRFIVMPEKKVNGCENTEVVEGVRPHKGRPLHLVIPGIVFDAKPQRSAYIKLADLKGRFSHLWKPAWGQVRRPDQAATMKRHLLTENLRTYWECTV